MPDVFIKKIKQIILGNIENEKFGVSELASEMGLSRSQILRKVKSTTGKSVNQLIREIRLEEGVKHIQAGELTASEIAYKIGFSSPSYFNKCFLDHFGKTPGEYKKENGEFISGNEYPHTKIVKNNSKRAKLLLYIFSVIIVITAVSLIYKNFKVTINKKQYQQASIAVLPLLDLSENKNKDYLAVGITDAITLELSKLKDLRVISRGSAMLFQDSSKLYSEIAELLGVDLLLEGSVLYGADSLRVIVQLIEPFPDEKHIWADKYNQESSNILKLVDKISGEIAKEINLIVQSDLTKPVIKEVNPVAYDLYIRGRYLWYQNNTDAVKKAIQYLEESIEIDSSYAMAYSTLAEAYISMNKFIRNNEEKMLHRLNSRTAIDKALEKAIELDGSLGAAYITKGNILRKFDWDWEGTKEMAEKGLQLDPNNSFGHILLSDYYLVKGKHEKAVDEALIAERLDPINPRTSCLVAERYFFAKQYEKSISQFKRVLELFPRYGFAWDGIGYVQFITGKEEDAMNSWSELHKIMGNHSMAEFYKTETVEKSLNHWLVEATGGSDLYCSNPTIISQAFMFVNNKQGGLEYLDIAYKYKNEDLPIMLLRPHFKPLYNNPRFQKIVKSTGVTIQN